MAAPDLIASTNAQSVSCHVTGPLVVGVSVLAAAPVLRSLRWLVLASATWQIIAPWVAPAAPAATINSVLVGLALATLTFAGRQVRGRYGGGWRVVADLLRPASVRAEAGGGHD